MQHSSPCKIRSRKIICVQAFVQHCKRLYPPMKRRASRAAIRNRARGETRGRQRRRRMQAMPAQNPVDTLVGLAHRIVPCRTSW
jgi:hypothetical protein